MGIGQALSSWMIRITVFSLVRARIEQFLHRGDDIVDKPGGGVTVDVWVPVLHRIHRNLAKVGETGRGGLRGELLDPEH